MSDQFKPVLEAEFTKHPLLKKLAPEKLTALADAFDNWQEIAAYSVEDLVAMFVESNLTTDEAKAIIAKAKAESASGETVEAVAVASVQTSVPASPFGSWDQYRLGAGDPLDLTAALAPKMDPAAIELFGNAALAMLCDFGGVDDAFFKIAQRRAKSEGPKIKDQLARDLLFTYRRMKEGGDLAFLKTDERAEAWVGVGNVLDDTFEQVLAACAQFFSMRDEAEALGDQARISVGTGKMTMAQVKGLLPLLAEKISERMAAGEIGERATLVIREYNDYVLKGLRMPAIQIASGVTPGEDPSSTMVEVLTNEGFEDATNALRAALAYNEVMRRLKMCPAQPDASFVIFIGEAAASVITYAAMLNMDGAEEVASQTPFRSEPVHSAPRPASRPAETTKRGWSITFRLQLIVRR